MLHSLPTPDYLLHVEGCNSCSLSWVCEVSCRHQLVVIIQSMEKDQRKVPIVPDRSRSLSLLCVPLVLEIDTATPPGEFSCCDNKSALIKYIFHPLVARVRWYLVSNFKSNETGVVVLGRGHARFDQSVRGYNTCTIHASPSQQRL